MDTVGRPVALVTGASRGIGAATALALAEHGYDVVITYRNKAARANEVASEITRRGVSALAVGCDITQSEDVDRLFATLAEWSGHLNLLVLNAAGGLERDTVIYVTSHWAHLHGQVDYMPGYAPVASTKHAGEQALRARQQELAERGIRLLVVTGDLIEGTIMAKMMERRAPGLGEERRQESQSGQLPSVTEMGEAIASAAMDTTLPGGYTVVVGGALDTFKRR